MKRNKIKLLLLSCFLVVHCLLSGCSSRDVKYIRNINEKDRSDIFNLNKTLFKFIRTGDSVGFMKMASEGSIVSRFLSLSDFSSVSKFGFNGDSMERLDECEVISQPNQSLSFEGNINHDTKYKFNFKSIGGDCYVSLCTIPSDVVGFKYLLTTQFRRENNEWKLASFYVGNYSYHDLVAKEYLDAAKTKLDDGDTLSAKLISQIVAALARPCSDNLRYVYDYPESEVIKSINYAYRKKYLFPISLNDITSKPEIVSFRLEVLRNKLYPCVFYKYHVSFDDSIALKNEYREVAMISTRMFPSLKKFTKATYYCPVSDFLDDKIVGRSRFFVDE